MSEACRICLQEVDPENSGSDLIYPCRCQAPVHRNCLDHWRAAGLNPANMTRCEVCHYHYRYHRGAKPYRLHLLIYGVVLLEIFSFIIAAVAVGQIIRATNVVDVIDWGRLSFMKPDTTRGWLFMGVCFNCFVIGVGSTLYLLVKLITGRWRRDVGVTQQRRSPGSWSASATERRQRSRDCCRDCCTGCSDDSHGTFLYCALMGPDCYCYPCEAACGSCDAQCSQCCDAMACDGCRDLPSCEACGPDCGENPCMLVCLFFFMFVAVALIFVGMFVMFWGIFVNVFYGMWLHQNYLRDLVASRYRVMEYDPLGDAEGKENASHSLPASAAAPAQQAMPAVIGNASPAKTSQEERRDLTLDEDGVGVIPGNLVTIDLR